MGLRRSAGELTPVLEEVRIRGLGVIDDATLPLGAGLTAVTGETGAGKTMVVSGLLLLFGARGEAARVRTGAEQTVVDGRVEIPAAGTAADRVRHCGGELDDTPGGRAGLVLRRTVTSAGRSRAYVGGAPTPVAVLGDLADHLLTVHGQSDQLRLTRPGEQRAALDRYAGLDTTDFAAEFGRWRDAAEAIAERRSRMAELRREADLLNHGVAEIADVDPQRDEDVELTAAASRLAHADALQLAARTAHDALLGNPDDPIGEASDVTAMLGAARRLLDAQQGNDAELDELTRRIVELTAVAADLGADFGSYAAGLDTDPVRLEQIEVRRAQLAALVRKYGAGPDAGLGAVHAWADAARGRLADIDVSDEAIAALTARRDEAAERVARGASELRHRRTAAAEALATAVNTELRELAMTDAACTIIVRPRAGGLGLASLPIDGAESAVGPDGADDVELRFRSHPDAPELPIGRGASGGELSRVMLALEVCLAGTDPVPTMIFDEVDAGVGGRAATEVGRRLARLGRQYQVVVVTHLAQVAAFADNHIVVDKNGASAGVTAADVRAVTGDQRVAELARMLGGNATESALHHAAELLRTAREEASRTTRTSTTRTRSRSEKRAVKTR
jgi:DNA repair protein RecN (Recombination protein N)